MSLEMTEQVFSYSVCRRRLTVLCRLRVDDEGIQPVEGFFMKIDEQHSPELIQLGKLIEDMSVAMLTTADDDGALASRPMAPQEMDGDGAIWFFTEKNSAKTQHLEAASLSFIHAAHGTYVSISGHGEMHTNREHIQRLWSPAVKPWFPDGPNSPNLALLKFVPNAAEYWDAPHSKMVRMFAMAASVVSGKPVAMGEHDTLTKLSPT
jgi:general stress protein 26